MRIAGWTGYSWASTEFDLEAVAFVPPLPPDPMGEVTLKLDDESLVVFKVAAPGFWRLELEQRVRRVRDARKPVVTAEHDELTASVIAALATRLVMRAPSKPLTVSEIMNDASAAPRAEQIAAAAKPSLKTASTERVSVDMDVPEGDPGFPLIPEGDPRILPIPEGDPVILPIPEAEPGARADLRPPVVARPPVVVRVPASTPSPTSVKSSTTPMKSSAPSAVDPVPAAPTGRVTPVGFWPLPEFVPSRTAANRSLDGITPGRSDGASLDHSVSLARPRTVPSWFALGTLSSIPTSSEADGRV